jgi:hypothetical protein
MNAQKNTQSVAQKPFCKVCHDAGKPESEYTSHFVRSDLGPKGKVVCPTLLSLECRYCFEKGHTVSFCVVLKKHKNADKKAVARTEFAEASVQSPLKAPTKATNRFGALDQDAASDKAKETQVKKQTKAKEEFPVLCGVPKKEVLKPSTTLSYAAQAAKALDMPVLTRQSHYKEKPAIQKKVSKRWADWTDSDDDEDEEVEDVEISEGGW